MTLLTALLLPVFAGARDGSEMDVSANNLRIIQQGLVCYAAEWDDRQWTTAPDDLGVSGGDCDAYQNAFGYAVAPLILGWGCEEGCDPDYLVDSTACLNAGVWGFYNYPNYCQRYTYEPIVFDGASAGAGSFRLPNAQPIHDYVVEEGWGRVYDPVYYAPADTWAYETAAPFFEEPCEYISAGGSNGGGVIPSSYCLSPAAMLDPGVLRGASAGGFQHPASYDDGFRSPTMSQVLFPARKTQVMEHHWLYDAPASCHPDLVLPSSGTQTPDCQPYLFNGGADAAPFAAFFDGSIQRVRVRDVVIADSRIRLQGGDGLWSRDTTFGSDGYFGAFSVDGTRASHHVLTTGGVRGRDWLGPQPTVATPRMSKGARR